MKKVILIFLAITISGKTVFAQNHLSETEKLWVTAKVWGFLKYYHPNVADGNYDWDAQLFEILPTIRSSTNKEQLSQIYIDWIVNLGSVRTCKACEQDMGYQHFEKNFDMNWAENDRVFSNELSRKLKHIERNRHQGKKYYVSTSKRIGNIEITNEKDYKGFDWQDINLRLLTLFRYWNIVEYFFPYKYQTDMNWDDVLEKMIPKFLYSETEMDFHLAMLELVVSIDDSHGGLVTNKTSSFFGNYWIPAKFKLINNKAIITGYYSDSLAKRDDIRIGDIISKVNDREVEMLFNERKKYISGSNISRKKYQAFNAIFNGSSDSVKIEFLRGNKVRTKIIKRYLLRDFTFKKKEAITHKTLPGNIGYVDMGVLKVKDVPKVMSDLKDRKAIILDLRNYPKGTLYSIANFITSESHDFYHVIQPDLNYPGKFVWRKNNRQCGKNGELVYKGKVVLLVNERSQSHSEFTAMCLQKGNYVTTIGSQTSGADGNVSSVEMIGGYKTLISGIGIFYPDNTETQRKGVKIDIEIKPTIQGVVKGTDQVLEKAIEFIND